MYVANKNKGIGEVIEMNEDTVTVYFEETDEEKKMAKAFVTLYNTIEEAEQSLEPVMTKEIADAVMAYIEEEKRIMREGANASAWLENERIEASKRLMRNI